MYNKNSMITHKTNCTRILYSLYSLCDLLYLGITTIMKHQNSTSLHIFKGKEKGKETGIGGERERGTEGERVIGIEVMDHIDDIGREQGEEGDVQSHV